MDTKISVTQALPRTRICVQYITSRRSDLRHVRQTLLTFDVKQFVPVDVVRIEIVENIKFKSDTKF